MAVQRSGRSYRLSFQSSIRHVLLGLVPAMRDATAHPRLVSLGPLTNGPSTCVDPKRVLKAVTQAIRDHEAETGVPVPIADVEYVPNDSPYYEKYYSLARNILLAIAPDKAAVDALQREAAAQRLGDAMSDLQERAFCGSWMCVTPTIVGLCRKAIRTGNPQGWGNCDLTVEQAKEMWHLAQTLGGWAEPDWDGDDNLFVIAYPFSPLEFDGLEGEQITWKTE